MRSFTLLWELVMRRRRCLLSTYSILEIYTYTLTWVSYQINSKLNVRIEQGKLFLESFIHIQLQVTLFSTQALKESEFIRAILFRFKKPPPSPSANPSPLSLSYLAMNWEYSTEVFPQPRIRVYSQGYIILLRFAASFWQPPINSNKLSPGAIDLISLGLWKLEIGNYTILPLLPSTIVCTKTQFYFFYQRLQVQCLEKNLLMVYLNCGNCRTPLHQQH